MILFQKPKPRSHALGLVTPYTGLVWSTILATLIMSAIILAICGQLSTSKRPDWTLHLLDSVNPMVGRPMSKPGFNTKTLGHGGQGLSFEIYLLTYSLCCLVIRTGYEGNLKSHLTAVVHPNLPITFEDFIAFGRIKSIITTNPSEAGLKALVAKMDESEVMSKNPYPVRIRTRSFMDTFLETLDGHAVATPKSWAKFVIAQKLTYPDGSNDMHFMDDFTGGLPLVFNMPRMNRFEGLIDRRIFQFVESGLYDINLKWRSNDKNVVYLSAEQSAYSDDAWTPMQWIDMRVAVISFSIALTVTLISFIGEIVAFKWKDK